MASSRKRVDRAISCWRVSVWIVNKAADPGWACDLSRVDKIFTYLICRLKYRVTGEGIQSDSSGAVST